MTRNMFHRVETCFPIKHKRIRDRMIEDLNLYLSDNTHAWILNADGNYQLLAPVDDEIEIDAQGILLDRWTSRH